MSLGHQFNRIAHLFNGGTEETKKAAGHWLEAGSRRAEEFARRARREAESRGREIVSFEESLVRHARENPALYVFAAAVVIGAVIAKLILEARQERRVPLL
jgi:hypothetical protein